LLTSSVKKSILKELQAKHFEIMSDEKARLQTYQDLSETYNIPVHEVEKLDVTIMEEAKKKIEKLVPKKREDLDDEDASLIPYLYRVNKKGICRVKAKSEQEEFIRVSRTPMFLRRYFINKSNNTILVELVMLENEREIKTVLPFESLSNNREVASLARFGAHCSSDNAKLLVKYFSDQFQTLKAIRKASYAVFSSGWFKINGKLGIALGGRCICDGLDVERLNEADKSLHKEEVFKAQGDKNSYFTELSKLLQDSPILICEMGAAASNPMLKLLGVDNAIFHKYGNSSVGKTIGMIIALSLIGDPSQTGLLRRWRATANGIESIADEYKDIILALDDLSQKVGSIGEINLLNR
jgi:uncharacterized protein (DUF927 family)